MTGEIIGISRTLKMILSFAFGTIALKNIALCYRLTAFQVAKLQGTFRFLNESIFYIFSCV